MVAWMLCPVLLAQLLIESEFYESTPATKALKLAAKPGELYGLEISSGFNDWVTVKEWYGLGQEVQQNLFAGSNTTGPANGDSNYSDPAVSLLVEPGVGGTGLVVSWRSLDNGSAQQVYLASSTLHPNWPPLISKSGGGHRFFIRKNPTLTTVNPPATTPVSSLDATMLAAFQSNLATFNAVVSSGNIASDPIARPPKVTETGLRQFYRIKKHASPDTDGDGIHDSRELMDTGTSPFSKNSDGDLYDDGDELLMGFSPLNPADLADNDADRIPNYLDVHPSNALLDWEKVDDTL